jgi:hypothetical protein
MRIVICYLLLSLLPAVTAWSQVWETVTADSTTFLWGEGWGKSVDEADRDALKALSTRISVAVVSGYSQSEEQVRSSAGDSYRVSQKARTETYSSVPLRGSHREVLRAGKKAHVGRWIRRDALDSLFTSRRERIASYEASALEAEADGRINEALRCHYWAYVLLRTLGDPGQMRSLDGRALLNTIPENINALLDGLRVRVTARSGGSLNLLFTSGGKAVEGLDFSYFDGAGWSPLVGVKDGRATIRMAPGAVAETIQLKVEYAYMGDAMMDDELRSMIDLLNLRPLRKSYLIFRAK